MVTIRNFEEGDVDFIFENWADNPEWQGCSFKKDKQDILALINEWKTKTYKDRYFEQFVVISKNIPVGMISLYEHSRVEASVGVYIDINHRRKGFASEAYGLVEKTAKEKGFNTVSASVLLGNEASIQLHLKLGFSKGITKLNKEGKSQMKFIKHIL